MTQLQTGEHLSYDEVYTSGGGPNGKSTLLGTISSTSPHELLMDHRPLKALLVQEGLIDNHPQVLETGGFSRGTASYVTAPQGGRNDFLGNTSAGNSTNPTLCCMSGGRFSC